METRQPVFPPVTLREFVAGAERFRITTWDHTSELIALLATIHGQGSSGVTRDQVHPFRTYQPAPSQDPSIDAQRMIKKHGTTWSDP